MWFHNFDDNKLVHAAFYHEIPVVIASFTESDNGYASYEECDKELNDFIPNFSRQKGEFMAQEADQLFLFQKWGWFLETQ